MDPVVYGGGSKKNIGIEDFAEQTCPQCKNKEKLSPQLGVGMGFQSPLRTVSHEVMLSSSPFWDEESMLLKLSFPTLQWAFKSVTGLYRHFVLMKKKKKQY